MNSKFLAKKANNLDNLIFSFLKKLSLNPRQTIVIGLSGGPDSVALLHILSRYKNVFNYNLIAAHLDHQWRDTSHLDVLFCQNICTQLDVEFITNKACELDFKFKFNGSQEEIGRKMRLYFLNQVAQQYQARHIALAHHLDDQIETFVIRLIRGTSLSGLGCMQTHAGIYIRPLLSFNKQEILDYLDQNNLVYKLDESNDSPAFLRNRVRKLLPALKLLDPRFKDNFAQSLTKIQAANNFINNLAKENLKLVTNNPDNLDQANLTIDLKKLTLLDIFLQKQVILQLLYQNQVKFVQTESFVDEILRFLNSPNGGTHQIHQNWLILKKQNQAQIIIC